MVRTRRGDAAKSVGGEHVAVPTRAGLGAELVVALVFATSVLPRTLVRVFPRVPRNRKQQVQTKTFENVSIRS